MPTFQWRHLTLGNRLAFMESLPQEVCNLCLSMSQNVVTPQINRNTLIQNQRLTHAKHIWPVQFGFVVHKHTY